MKKECVNCPAAPTVKAEQVKCTTCQDSGIVGHSDVCQQSVHVSVPMEWLDAVKELFDAKQAKEDFERENPGNSTKRWDACLYRIEAAEDALRALLNGGEA